MALPDGYRFIDLTEDARRDALEVNVWAFPTGTAVDDFMKLPLAPAWDRTVGVAADGADGLLAMYSSYEFSRFPVPGARIAVGGLTWVGVHPGHRRRGLLRAIVERHLAECSARGETVSALFAAEDAIYGRFGYGQAATDRKLTIPRGAALRPVAGSEDHAVRLEVLDADRHGDLIASVHVRAGEGTGGLNRPGWATRETPPLRAAHLSDPPAFRGGKEARRIAIVERDGEPRGYATFRRSVEWADGGPRGPVECREVVALDAAAAHRLWSVLLDLDLSHEVQVSMLAPDDAIFGLLLSPRAARARVSDNVWVRVVDVAAALAARTYAGDLDVVLDVSDDMVPANTGSWRVRANAFGTAEVQRTTASGDLSISVQDLGAAYLGGVTLAALATAGRVAEHTPGALPRASAAFSWPLAPVCSWVF